MSQESLLARVAHRYYVLGETQQAIAQHLGMTRIKVHRLLAEARDRGIVTIAIRARSAETLQLEAELCDRYALGFCNVTPSDRSAEKSLSEIVGIYAAQALPALLGPDMTLAVAWGVTLQSLARAMEPMPLEGATVAPLLGSLSRRSSIDQFEASTMLAQRLQAECYYLPGPIIADTRESRETILQQPLAREVLAKALSADLALVSVGGVKSHTLRSVGYLPDDTFEEVRALGAIGNFLGYFLDAAGEIVDHPVNERVIGVHPFDFISIASRVLVSGGERKVAIMKTLLEAGTFTGLITDLETARSL